MPELNVNITRRLRRPLTLWAMIGLAVEYGWRTLRAALRGDEVIVLVSGSRDDVAKLIPPKIGDES
jgi:hypothetical protein